MQRSSEPNAGTGARRGHDLRLVHPTRVTVKVLSTTLRRLRVQAHRRAIGAIAAVIVQPTRRRRVAFVIATLNELHTPRPVRGIYWVPLCKYLVNPQVADLSSLYLLATGMRQSLRPMLMSSVVARLLLK